MQMRRISRVVSLSIVTTILTIGWTGTAFACGGLIVWLSTLGPAQETRSRGKRADAGAAPVSFRQVEETQAAWIDDYLRVALTLAGLTEEMGDGGTTVRVMQGPKRRPG